MTHICVGKLISIGSDNGLSPDRAIIWTNARLLSIGPFRTYFNENLIKIQQFSLKKIPVKTSAKWRPSCLGLNVLNNWACCQEQYSLPMKALWARKLILALTKISYKIKMRILNDVAWSTKTHSKLIVKKNIKIKNVSNFVVSTAVADGIYVLGVVASVPTDALAPYGARASAGTDARLSSGAITIMFGPVLKRPIVAHPQ